MRSPAAPCLQGAAAPACLARSRSCVLRFSFLTCCVSSVAACQASSLCFPAAVTMSRAVPCPRPHRPACPACTLPAGHAAGSAGRVLSCTGKERGDAGAVVAGNPARDVLRHHGLAPEAVSCHPAVSPELRRLQDTRSRVGCAQLAWEGPGGDGVLENQGERRAPGRQLQARLLPRRVPT